MAKGIERLWRDSCAVYRQTAGANGDPAGWSLVSEGNPCNYHGTPNYDQLGRVLLLKEDSVQTSDSVTLGIEVDVQSGDLLKLTLRTGQEEWVKVSGAPKVRTLVPKKTIFVTTDRPPLEGELV
jgi:hypothetical protein